LLRARGVCNPCPQPLALIVLRQSMHRDGPELLARRRFCRSCPRVLPQRLLCLLPGIASTPVRGRPAEELMTCNTRRSRSACPPMLARLGNQVCSRSRNKPPWSARDATNSICLSGKRFSTRRRARLIAPTSFILPAANGHTQHGAERCRNGSSPSGLRLFGSGGNILTWTLPAAFKQAPRLNCAVLAPGLQVLRPLTPRPTPAAITA